MNVKNLFKAAAEKKSSDIHLLVGEKPIVRVDGELKSLDSIYKDKDFSSIITSADLNAAVDAILSKEQKARLTKDKDLDCGYSVDGVRFRINLSYEKDHLRLVARIIEEKKPTLDEIGMPEVVKELLSSHQGLILVTGPTGCGKSTTLAAMINYINSTRSCNIVTLEDPIEYIFNSDKSIISQRQLGSDMTSFASGLKHVLRQDPNVIMIGEMRDLETISAAITLAETGHLVLATLHTYNAVQTIDRIIDTFPSQQQNQIKSQLSMLLGGVISQRLLPSLKGGRIAAREVLVRNAAASNLIREGKLAQLKTVMETHRKEGMLVMDTHLKELYQSGEISVETARAYADNPDVI